MKGLLLFLTACATGWWGYRKLRSHPLTAPKVAEVERQGQRIVDQANDAMRSAKDQAVSKVAGIAATGAQSAADSAADKQPAG